MKILYITQNQVGQGTYWRAYHLGRQLALRGYQMTLLASSEKNRFEIMVRQDSGLEIIETPDLGKGRLRGYDLWNTFRRSIWLRGREFDLVHGFESRPTVIYPALFAKQTNRAPLILDWADWFGSGGSVEERQYPLIRTALRPIETFYENHFRTQVNGNTIICTTLQDRAIALGIEPKKILLLPNGSDIDRLHPMPIAQARQGTKFSEQDFVIGYVGTIFGRDAKLMADTFNLISAQLPNAHLLIVGYCPENIQSMVREPNKVIQTGKISDSDLGPILSGSDIFWLPLSDTNANRGRFPLKLTDYLALGRPIIASAVGDIPDVFSKATIGLLCEPDPEAFYRATLELYQNPNLRLIMGENARRLAETTYSWYRISIALEDFYRIITQKS